MQVKNKLESRHWTLMKKLVLHPPLIPQVVSPTSMSAPFSRSVVTTCKFWSRENGGVLLPSEPGNGWKLIEFYDLEEN